METNSEQLPSFEIQLDPEGDSGANFRTENDPNDPEQRKNVINRQGVVLIKCDVVDIAHGYWSADADDLASLIILSFRFEPLSSKTRIKSIEIEARFANEDSQSPDPDPAVENISLDGYYSVQPTTRNETVSTTIGGALGGGWKGAEASTTATWTKSSERQRTDMVTVQGYMNTVGRNYGKPNVAHWVLRENSMGKSGVPTSMQVAIRLRRQSMDRFLTYFTVKAQLERTVAATMARLRSDPRDDPVILNPWLKATNVLKSYDTDALGGEDIEQLTRVTVITKLEDTGGRGAGYTEGA